MATPTAIPSPLAQLAVLFVDAQATAGSPERGALVELGWACGTAATALGADAVEAHLIAPPPDARLPRSVSRVTGIQPKAWREGLPPQAAWARLCQAAASLAPPPATLVIHFARFEAPFLQALQSCHGARPFPFQLVCTHAIARRLLPGLPRCSLRALAGYFGAGVSALRRSADHVTATAFVWRHLVSALDAEGVRDLPALGDWLLRPAPRRPTTGRCYPLPRERRAALPRGPGVYRFQREGGAVVYVGKAGSLRGRVGGHFYTRDGERALEMLSQVRDVSCTETETALEAALLEADEIKRLAPPYNRALVESDRALVFATADLTELSGAPDTRHVVGPLPSRALFDSLAALRQALAANRPVPLRARARAVGVEPAQAPGTDDFTAGCTRFVAWHGSLGTARDVLRVGARLWVARREATAQGQERAQPRERPAEKRRFEWNAERVTEVLEQTVLRSAHAIRRARWLLRLSESSLVWSEVGRENLRLLVIEAGRVVGRADVEAGAAAPVPPASRRSSAERRAFFDLAGFDRLRVLTTELRTLAAAAPSPEVRLGAWARLRGRRLQTVLRWV